ncbi:hypothetical protein OBBRIDRAFT_742139, partial [Obba rivulosa]
FVAYFSQWQNLKVLIGTAYSWFVFHVAFYGLGLNTSIILAAMRLPFDSTGGRFDNLLQLCVGNLIPSVAGYIPGYWATFFFIDQWGRKPIQRMGFFGLSVFPLSWVRKPSHLTTSLLNLFLQGPHLWHCETEGEARRFPVLPRKLLPEQGHVHHPRRGISHMRKVGRDPRTTGLDWTQ